MPAARLCGKSAAKVAIEQNSNYILVGAGHPAGGQSVLGHGEKKRHLKAIPVVEFAQ
jgi:hypothetical protein